MNREGMPSGTPMQIEVFDAAYRAELSGYPGWSTPGMFWQKNEVQSIDVTPQATRLLGAQLLAWELAWRPGADRGEKYQLQPTDAGLAWRERCAARERRAAARRDTL